MPQAKIIMIQFTLNHIILYVNKRNQQILISHFIFVSLRERKVASVRGARLTICEKARVGDIIEQLIPYPSRRG